MFKSWHNWSLGVGALFVCWSLGYAAIESGQQLGDFGIAFGGIGAVAGGVAGMRAFNKWAEVKNGNGGGGK